MYVAPCFGVCASFTVRVNGDGTATYKGLSNTERKGTWTGQVPKEKVSGIIDSLTKDYIWSLETYYGVAVTDGQIITTTLFWTKEGKQCTHEIENYVGGAPQKLVSIQEAVSFCALSQIILF